MSLSYDLFAGYEALSESVSQFEDLYKQFTNKAEDIRGRLYAMLKKLNNPGPVNTEIKYLKAKYLENPSQLVIDVSQRVNDQIIFNEKICKYDEKLLNRVTAKKAIESHVRAIEELIGNKKVFEDAIKAVKDEQSKQVKCICRNFDQVGKHLCWSSRRLLANVRIGASKNTEDLDELISQNKDK